MNFVEQYKFIDDISRMNIPDLRRIRRELQKNVLYEDREIKLPLIDIMINGKKRFLKELERL